MSANYIPNYRGHLARAVRDVRPTPPVRIRRREQWAASTRRPAARGEAVNLLNAGELYGEGLRLWDLKFAKNIRFAGKRVNLGVDIYNLFNSDAATRLRQHLHRVPCGDST